MISPLAFVHPEAKIGENVEIGPFAIVEKDVEIGDGTIVDGNATICEHTRIGKRCHIFPSAVVGAIPQDLKFKGELTYTFIGNDTHSQQRKDCGRQQLFDNGVLPCGS